MADRLFARLPPLMILERMTFDLIARARDARTEIARTADLNEAIRNDDSGRLFQLWDRWRTLQASDDFVKFGPMPMSADRPHVNIIGHIVGAFSGEFNNLPNAEQFREHAMRALDYVVTVLNRMRRTARPGPV